MTTPILKRLISQLKAKGFNDKSAHAIAISKQQDAGNLKKGSTEPTAKGKQRGSMTAGERAKDRAARKSGKHLASEYSYNKKTNMATLKKK
jgi:hypothetical protein